MCTCSLLELFSGPIYVYVSYVSTAMVNCLPSACDNKQMTVAADKCDTCTCLIQNRIEESLSIHAHLAVLACLDLIRFDVDWTKQLWTKQLFLFIFDVLHRFC